MFIYREHVDDVNALEELISRQLRARGVNVLRTSAGPDLLVEVPTPEGPVQMVVEVKTGSRRPGENPRNGKPVMLGERFVSARRGQALRSSGIPFVDSVGNMWLELLGFFVDVEGRPPPARPRETPTAADRLSRPASQRIVFALLVRPDLTRATLRDLAGVAGTSLGAAQAVVADLITRGYLYKDGHDRRLSRAGALADRWVSDFPNRLLPKLRTLALRGPEPSWWFGRRAELEASGTAVGGEAAGELLGHPFRSVETLLYGTPPWGAVRKLGRLGEKGPATVVLRERFWSADVSDGKTAPPLLVYADLLSTDEPRQLQLAQDMRAQDADLRRLWA